jgi:hypothetical protein
LHSSPLPAKFSFGPGPFSLANLTGILIFIKLGLDKRERIFSHSALDIKTYAMALLKQPYRDSTKRDMPKRWFDPMPHTHQALDDALEQGALFCNMLQENLTR